MPGQHATLSPSASHRWLECPASIRVVEQIPKVADDSSPYAHEGTLAHALGEIEASYYFDLISHKDYVQAYEAWRLNANLDLDTLGEMKKHIRGYVEYIEERMTHHKTPVVMFEKRMDTGVPRCWGTSDVVILGEDSIEIIDLKYGAGVYVAPDDNSQLKLYGLGALDTFGDLLATTKTVTMSIYQPRVTGGIGSWTITAKELRAWRRDVAVPTARLALTDNAPFGPSEKACRWCPAAGDCLARAKKLAGDDFSAPYVEVQKPDLLQPEEMSTILSRLPAIRSWVEAVEVAALRRIYDNGEEVPGWKAVRSGGRRNITDPERAIDLLAEASEQYARDDFYQAKKIKNLGDLEKMVGVKGLPRILGPELLKKGEGSISLAPEDDKREAVSPKNEAAKDFADDE